MPDDEEFETREGIIVGLIALGALLFLMLTLFLASFGEGVDYTGGLGDLNWGFKEWSTLGIFVLIAGSILLAIYWGSDDEGTDDVFEGGYGFPATVAVLLIALLMVNTQFFGLAKPNQLLDTTGDGIGDTYSDDLPAGYVDYGEPQPYGYGNYGPEAEGWFSGTEGAAIGGSSGCAVGLAVGLSGAPWTLGISVPIGLAVGCLGGAALGYGATSSDFDGDPTTGW
jgi:hypothetical protein